MVVAAIISSICLTLWYSTNIDAQIAGNTYKISQARFAAQSGISHFLALNPEVEDAYHGIVIPETRLTSKTFYVVEIYRTVDGKTAILSKGMYKKGSRIIFQYPIRAAVEKSF
tara:strand:- start:1554 stop:1892 length:339 start_codon:yes stop_codon:yes gene_type:complete